jgi:heme a synthase
MKRKQPHQDQRTTGRWATGLAWTLVSAAFLSILVGGMLTGYGAGGGPSDAPGGLHHFVFLYPTGAWLSIWDVFLEHAHRFLGTVAVLSGTVLVLILPRMDLGKDLRRTAILVAAGFWIECVLGGAGALLGRSESITIAAVDGPLLLTRMHAWIAPLVFAAAVLLVEQLAKTAPSPTQSDRSHSGQSKWLIWLVTGGVYLQIVLGGQLRYVALDAAPWWFTLAVWSHVTSAGIVACGVGWLLLGIRGQRDRGPIATRIRLVGILFTLQVAFGISAWVTSYGWPLWFTDFVLAWEHNIVAEGILQVTATTAHVTIASLCLAAAVSLALRVKPRHRN